MAKLFSRPDDEAFLAVIDNTLAAQVRESLKAPLMKQAEAMVDEAVDAAVKALGPRIQAWVNEQYRSLDVRVVVNRVGEPEKAPLDG